MDNLRRNSAGIFGIASRNTRLLNQNICCILQLKKSLEEVTMNRVKLSFAAVGIVATLATGALVVTSLPSAAAEAEMTMPATAAEHAAEATKYEQEALELESKAARHTDLAAQYRARLSGSGKQTAALRSLTKHCESIAKAYRTAATEAREMAKSHREMTAAG